MTEHLLDEASSLAEEESAEYMMEALLSYDEDLMGDQGKKKIDQPVGFVYDPVRGPSPLLDDAMRDPVAMIFSYLDIYSQKGLRRICKKLFDHFEYCMYLETVLPGAFVAQTRGTKQFQPVDLRLLAIGKVKTLVQQVRLYGFEGHELPTGFLCRCVKLEEASIVHLPGLLRLPPGFLSQTSELRHLTFSDLPVLRVIDSNFLKGTALEKFTLSRLESLVQIGSGFLRGCRQLQEVVIYKVPHLLALPDFFCAECPKLSTVKLSLPALCKGIGNHAFEHCDGLQLKSLDGLLVPDPEELEKSVRLGTASSELASLNFNPSRYLMATIGSHFLSSSGGIETFCLNDSRTNLCSGNEEDSFAGVFPDDVEDVKLQVFGRLSAFSFSHCKNLKEIRLENLKNLKIIEDGVGSQCPVLKKVVITNCGSLVQIKDNVLAWSPILETVVMENLSSLQVIASGFAMECPKLEELQTVEVQEDKQQARLDTGHPSPSLTSVKKIGSNFLAGTALSEFLFEQAQQTHRFFNALEEPLPTKIVSENTQLLAKIPVLKKILGEDPTCLGIHGEDCPKDELRLTVENMETEWDKVEAPPTPSYLLPTSTP